MKTFYAPVTILFSLLSIICFAQPSLPTDYFRSFTTGDWAGLPTWQSSHDNITYFPATLIPTSSAINILIQNLHTVTISTSGISLANTSIQSGGILEITSTFAYAIDGTGDNLVVESGGILLLNFTTLSAPAGLGTALIKTGGKVVANAVGSAAGANAIGDNYLNVNSKFTYQDKSIFEWNIANYIFNSTGLKDYFKTTSGTDIPILRISIAPIASFGTSSNNILNCILEVNAPFNISGSGIKTFRGGLSGTNTLNQTDGFITLPNASSVLDGSLTINTISSGLRFTNGAVVPVGATVKITVPIENQTINKQSGNLQVNGTLDITNCRISNTGVSASVTIANGGVLKTNNTSGFSGGGAAIVVDPIILETNSTVEFNRAGDQNFNDRTDFKNLTFSGSGIKRPVNAFNPVGTVKITGDAILDCIHNIGDASTNLTMDGGRLIVSTGIVQPMMGGVYNLTGGVVEFAGASFKRIRSETYQHIEVTGSDVNNSSSNIVLRDLGTFTIKTGGVFKINDNGITGPLGTQTIIVENGGTFNSGNNEGFHGFNATFTNNSSIHSNVENIILHSGSTVVYSRDNNQQITNANGLSYQNLIIAGTTGLKTAPSGTLIILGNLTKSGASNFEHNNGTILLNGTSQSFAGLTYNNLLLDNAGTKTLTGNAEITDSICLSNSITRPATVLALADNFITLKSSATKTARVGIIPNEPGVDIIYGNGRFVVERYFPPRRAWRLITAPITADASRNSVYRSWQSGGVATLLSGTFVSGKDPDPLNNGLDITPLNNSSLKTFDPLTSTFVPVSNTKTMLISGTTGHADNFGFFIFIRGDRSTTNLFYPPYSLPTTLRDTGKILIKDQSFSISGPENIGYSLLGNPYASPVRITRIVANTPGINNDLFYVYDPHLNIADGGYITVFRGADNEWYTNVSSPGNQDSIIQSCQAIFVQRISYSASVLFKEEDKWPANNLSIFRPLTENNPVTKGHYFRTNLYLLNADSTITIADGTIVEFNEHNTNAIDNKDAVKFNNIRETLGLQRDGNTFSVERRNMLSEFDTLFLKLTKTTKRSYQFEFIPENLDPLLMGILEDNYTGNKTSISLLTPSVFSFIINDDSASSAPDRFQVTFKMLPSGPLPVVLSTIRAKKQEDDIVIEWEVESQLNILQYEIERSHDGLHFSKVHTTLALTQPGLIVYKWLDVNPIQGNNFYRIKIIDNNGATNYSQIVKISFSNEISSISVSPNPSIDGSIALQLINQPKGIFYLRVMNNAGQLLNTQLFNNEGGNTVKIISRRTGRLTMGIYHLHITKPSKEEVTIKILVQSK